MSLSHTHVPPLLGRGLGSDLCEPAELGRDPARDWFLEVPADVGREEPGERDARETDDEIQPNLEEALSTNCCHCGGMTVPRTIVEVSVHATLKGLISSTDSTSSGSGL